MAATSGGQGRPKARVPGAVSNSRGAAWDRAVARQNPRRSSPTAAKPKPRNTPINRAMRNAPAARAVLRKSIKN